MANTIRDTEMVIQKDTVPLSSRLARLFGQGTTADGKLGGKDDGPVPDSGSCATYTALIRESSQ